MYAYLDENHANERKSGMTDDQFYYKSRKRAIGAFKKAIWDLSEEDKSAISLAWESQFTQLFESLSIADTKGYVQKYINPVRYLPSLSSYINIISGDQEGEDTTDLAD